MTMHPYRISSLLEPSREPAVREPGLRLAFGVMTAVAAVQVAIAIPHPGSLVLQTLFGGVCLLAGMTGLVRHCPA
jgi:hypothetical protein